MKFKDRREAGRALAEDLGRYKDRNPLVLALPRGGVPVGYEVARALDAPLDVLVARKLGAPGQPEFGLGAIASGGQSVVDEASVKALNVTREQMDAIIAREEEELARREERYRKGRPFPDVEGHTVILVDDGLATGATARAAVTALKARNPRELVLAAPVAPRESVQTLAQYVDDVVVLNTPEPFYAVGMWFENFEQTTDEEVESLLESAHDFGGRREEIREVPE